MTIALLFIGLYLVIKQPTFYIGKQNLFNQTIIPFYSIIALLNSLLIFSLNLKIEIIPKNKTQLSLILFLTTTTLFSIFNYPQNTLTFFSLILFYYNLRYSPKLQIQKNIYISTLIVSIIAMTQFIMQADLNLHFLGEPQIQADIKGIAKLNQDIIRPYGLFQHPNILAGILVLSSFINPFSRIGRSFTPQYIAIISSFSLNGIIALTSKYLKTTKQLLILTLASTILFLILKSPDFILERISQVISIFHNPNQLKPWLIQPIHNTFILSFTTFGPVHFLSLAWLIYNLFHQNKPFAISLLILLSFDHYFLTSFQALPLLILISYIVSLQKSKQEVVQTQAKTLEN